MEFEKAMSAAEAFLTFTPRFIDPNMPQGLWICSNAAEVSAIEINAVCLGSGCEWDDIVKTQPFLDHFPFLVIVTPNAIARDEMVRQLRPRLPASCIYVITDIGFRNCKTMQEYVELYGSRELPSILSGAEELPAYGILNLAQVARRGPAEGSPRAVPVPVLDKGIGGFFAGELSVWTGKRGVGKSTILGQLLLEAIDQGHTVCAYSGELPKEQFREWIYLQAAGPEHIVYETDEATGKRLAMADLMADKLDFRVDG